MKQPDVRIIEKSVDACSSCPACHTVKDRVMRGFYAYKYKCYRMKKIIPVMRTHKIQRWCPLPKWKST